MDICLKMPRYDRLLPMLNQSSGSHFQNFRPLETNNQDIPAAKQEYEQLPPKTPQCTSGIKSTPGTFKSLFLPKLRQHLLNLFDFPLKICRKFLHPKVQCTC